MQSICSESYVSLGASQLGAEEERPNGKSSGELPHRSIQRLTRAWCPLVHSIPLSHSHRESCITYGDCVRVISSSDRANTTLAFSA